MPLGLRADVSGTPPQREAAPPTPEPSRWPVTFYRRKLILLAGLAICAALPYANTLSNKFVYDDNLQIVGNPYVQNFHYLRQIFTTGVWSFQGGQTRTNYYRPLMSLGYLLCNKLFGRKPFGFHVVNILLQVLVVCVLFVTTERLFRDRILAFWTAFLFALHPIHTESVAWIGGATDLELAFFYLIAFSLFLQLGRTRGTSLRIQLAMLASFALAAISKEPALTLPPLAMIYEHIFRADRQQTTWRQKIARYYLLWLAAAAYLVARIHFLGTFAPTAIWPGVTRKRILLSAVVLFGQHLGKILYPVQLCAAHMFHPSVSLFDWHVIAGGLAVLGFVALFAVLWRRAHDLSFGLIWFVATLLPVLNARWVGEHALGERYLYLPSVGFCWVIAWGGLRFWQRLGSCPRAYRHAFAAGIGILAVLCSIRIITRNRDWHDNLTLYTQTLRVSPDAYDFRNNLGTVYDAAGDTGDAEREWREVLRTHPKYSLSLSNLGMLYARQGLYSLATRYLEETVKVDPKFPVGHTNLGFAYADTGKLDQAEAQFRSAISLAPLDVRARVGLAYFYFRTGDDHQVMRTLQQAEAINSSSSDVHSALGKFYASKGRHAEARREYEKALSLDANNLAASDWLTQSGPTRQ